jgi:uncharacterized protein (TIGR02646 family)
MIRINRPDQPPQSLARRGGEQRDKDCAEYDNCPDEYRSGRKKFDSFNRRIYAANVVKVALLKVHAHKCCYCEKEHIPANLAIEHFRPKSGVKQNRKQRVEYPGYFWLAYNWNNLLLSCNDCNTKFKQTPFPLSNPESRARSHNDDITIERPLFIDPASQDPRTHIRFRGAVPVHMTEAGRITIKELGLRRITLRDKRMEKLELLNRCQNIIELAEGNPSNTQWRPLSRWARRILRAAIRPDAEFSSMAQDFLQGCQS